ncbi:MAG: hypothetical protein K8H86_11070, partial [Ignavibacteriaceae bacterium]|nr:hypothetical protein [Ignavibacteriaceae bacterium]
MKLIYVIPMFFLLAACGEQRIDEKPADSYFSSVTDSISAESEKILFEDAKNQFYFPRYSPDGSKVFVTGNNYKGIWSYNIEDKKLLKLTGEEKSGYEYVSSKEGKTIYFIGAKFLDDIRRYDFALQSVNTENGTTTKLLSTRDRLSDLKLIDDSTLAFFFNDSLAFFSTTANKFTTLPESDFRITKIYGNKLFVYTKAGKTELTPFGEDNIIYADQSRKNDDLFYAAGKGLYKYSSSGEFMFLGDFQNAKYSPNGKMIAYTLEENDGLKTTNSDIYAAVIGTRIRSYKLTASENINEANPSWSPDGGSIIFNTTD